LNLLTLIKNKFIIIISVLFLLTVLFIIFSRPKTSSKLSEDKFVEVYVQLSIASEMYDTSSTELEEERKKIFEKYSVTQEGIDHFVKEYNRNPEKWAKVWEKIVRKLEEEVDRSPKEKANPP
jgi:hypothetical protein